MNRHLDFAFQKLFNWTVNIFKSLKIDALEIDPTTRKAIRILAERPTLFKKCLDTFSEMRRKLILKDFMTALTSGDGSRPIDVQAHDPLRYLGDILAWTHQAVAGEKEILAMFFGVAANVREKSALEPGNERWLGDEIILLAIDELLEKDLEGTYRPIQVYLSSAD